MRDFSEWQAQMAAVSAQNRDAIVLFLAYQSSSESEALAAGCQFVGMTWDANGTQVKAYKPRLEKLPAYTCTNCNSSYATLDHGMYCCGRKRVLR
jgi:hypothetical protein